MSATQKRRCLKSTLAVVLTFALGACNCLHEVEPSSGIFDPSAVAQRSLSESTLALDVSEITYEFPSRIYCQGLEFTHRFVIRNSSDHVVRLAGPHGMSPCCGRASLDRYDLEPGNSAQLTMTLRASLPVSSGSCVVWTDCPSQRELRFTLNARDYPAERMMAFDDSELGVFHLRVGETTTSPVCLERYADVGAMPDALPCIVSTDPNITVSRIAEFGEAKNIDPTVSLRRWRFELTVNAGHMPGPRTAFLRVSHGDEATSEHGVRLSVKSALEVEPARIVVTQSAGDSLNRSIRVTSWDGEAFEIKSLRSSQPGIEVNCQIDAPRTSHELVIRIADPDSCQWRSAIVLIETNRTDQPSTRLPIYLLAAAAGEGAEKPEGQP